MTILQKNTETQRNPIDFKIDRVYATNFQEVSNKTRQYCALVVVGADLNGFDRQKELPTN